MSSLHRRNRDDDAPERAPAPLPPSDGVLVMRDAELREVRRQEHMETSGMGSLMLGDPSLNYHISALTVPPAREVTYTVEEGFQIAFDKNAPYINVGIHYITGNEVAGIVRQENENIGKGVPVQRHPTWKVRTAMALLKEVELDDQHRMTFNDMTPAILQRRDEVGEKAVAGRQPSQKKGSRVNISSEQVQLINNNNSLGGGKTLYDLKALCVELHGASLVNLIANFQSLICEKGTSVLRSAQETSEILEMMVEDARRLLVWSPILGRMAHRPVIQESRDTRYGCDTGKAFCTLATSWGIAQTIMRGVSYLSELETTSSRTAFHQIKPKVMQMVVLLLSLLNDRDLSQIKGVLEHQYRLAADRQSIELTIMKVLTLESVGPSLFLSSALSAFLGQRQDIENFNTQAQRAAAWDLLLFQMASLGWILPGSLVGNAVKKKDQTAQGKRKYSWKLQWDEFRSTDIFDLLQFNGERNEVNNIPPLKIQAKEFDIPEVPVDLRDGRRYMVALKDLDSITLAKPGIYELLDPSTKRRTDLRIDIEEGFSELLGLWNDVRKLYIKVDDHLSSQEPNHHRGSSKSLTKFIARLGGNSKNPRAAREALSPMPQITQQRNKITMTIQNSPTDHGSSTPIAVCWLLGGTKATQDQLLTSVLDDYNELSKAVRNLHTFASSTRQRIGSNGRDRAPKSGQPDTQADQIRQLDILDAELSRIDAALGQVNDMRRAYRQQAAPLPDEAIGRVHYPDPVHYKQSDDMPWQPFTTWPDKSPDDLPETWWLNVYAERVAVEQTPSWSGGVGTFDARIRGGQMATVQVTPLEVVPETHWQFEVMKDDQLLLLGRLGVVLNRNGKVVNYLKLTSLQQHEISNPRPDDDEEQVAMPPKIKLF